MAVRASKFSDTELEQKGDQTPCENVLRMAENQAAMKLLRVEDVAEILSCSTKAVYSLKDRGVLPFCKIGGMIRFRAEDVTELISSSLTSRDQQKARPSSLPRLRSL